MKAAMFETVNAFQSSPIQVQMVPINHAGTMIKITSLFSLPTAQSRPPSHRETTKKNSKSLNLAQTNVSFCSFIGVHKRANSSGDVTEPPTVAER